MLLLMSMANSTAPSNLMASSGLIASGPAVGGEMAATALLASAYNDGRVVSDEWLVVVALAVSEARGAAPALVGVLAVANTDERILGAAGAGAAVAAPAAPAAAEPEPEPEAEAESESSLSTGLDLSLVCVSLSLVFEKFLIPPNKPMRPATQPNTTRAQCIRGIRGIREPQPRSPQPQPATYS